MSARPVRRRIDSSRETLEGPIETANHLVDVLPERVVTLDVTSPIESPTRLDAAAPPPGRRPTEGAG